MSAETAVALCMLMSICMQGALDGFCIWQVSSKMWISLCVCACVYAPVCVMHASHAHSAHSHCNILVRTDKCAFLMSIPPTTRLFYMTHREQYGARMKAAIHKRQIYIHNKYLCNKETRKYIMQLCTIAFNPELYLCTRIYWLQCMILGCCRSPIRI